ncbi:MAG: flagellar biosynthetic protein FliR [Bacteriovoracaceae bacterium]
MIGIQIIDHNLIVAFWLCFTRIITIFIQLPLFDQKNIPTLVKVLLTLIISYAFFPLISKSILQDMALFGRESFWVLTLFNAAVGLGLGFLVKAIMQIFLGTGALISQEVGFGMVKYFDPNSSQQIGPIENLLHWTILVLVISTGALQPMFKGVISSFEFFSISKWSTGNQLSLFYIDFFKNAFSASLMLASPLIFTNFIIMVILGIIARIVPQMNVLMVSFIVNIGLGLIVFITCSEEIFNVGYKLYAENLGNWFQFLK